VSVFAVFAVEETGLLDVLPSRLLDSSLAIGSLQSAKYEHMFYSRVA
jgi:hypothetical protein